MKIFWKKKSLTELNNDEWESLCDGCGRCCLQKLENEDNGEVHYTQLVCHLYDMAECECSDYENRSKLVKNCVKLNASKVKEFHWLPTTCAYRLLSEGKALYDWHPLISGTSSSVVNAGIGIKGRVLPEQVVNEEEWEEHVVHWVK